MGKRIIYKYFQKDEMPRRILVPMKKVCAIKNEKQGQVGLLPTSSSSRPEEIILTDNEDEGNKAGGLLSPFSSSTAAPAGMDVEEILISDSEDEDKDAGEQVPPPSPSPSASVGMNEDEVCSRENKESGGSVPSPSTSPLAPDGLDNQQPAPTSTSGSRFDCPLSESPISVENCTYFTSFEVRLWTCFDVIMNPFPDTPSRTYPVNFLFRTRIVM
jgi:hypothetical protein